MPYGLQINNSSGSLAISSERVVPRYMGRATYTGSQPTGGVATLLNYIISGLTPGHQYIICYTLPYTGWYYGQLGSQAYTANGSGQISPQLITNGSASPVPAVLVFALSPPTSYPSGQYGLALWNSSNQLMYHTSAYPLMITAMPSIPVGSSVFVSGMPSQPAFFPYSYFQIRYINFSSGGGSGPGSSGEQGRFAGFRWNGDSYLHSSDILYFSTSHPGNHASLMTFTYGSTSAQPVPIINSALYD